AGEAGERQVAAAIGAHMKAVGLDVEVHDAAPGRPNVVGVLEGRRKGRWLMFCGHSDTVGVEGMAAPFDPVERDGRLYGRGAQDMKGGVAAILAAARAIAERNLLCGGKLVVAIVADEEHASIGAEHVAKTMTCD